MHTEFSWTLILVRSAPAERECSPFSPFCVFCCLPKTHKPNQHFWVPHSHNRAPFLALLSLLSSSVPLLHSYAFYSFYFCSCLLKPTAGYILGMLWALLMLVISIFPPCAPLHGSSPSLPKYVQMHTRCVDFLTGLLIVHSKSACKTNSFVNDLMHDVCVQWFHIIPSCLQLAVTYQDVQQLPAKTVCRLTLS